MPLPVNGGFMYIHSAALLPTPPSQSTDTEDGGMQSHDLQEGRIHVGYNTSLYSGTPLKGHLCIMDTLLCPKYALLI